MTTPHDALSLLTQADEVWARQRRRPASPPEYLIHLAAAFGGDSLDRTVELERVTVERDAAREHVRSLVIAVTGRWGRQRAINQQVSEALRQLDVVRDHLEWLYRHPQVMRPESEVA